MRDAFIRTLIERARVDKRVFLIIGDLGFGVVEGFAAEFPERFVNAGVSEQSMIGVAAGLADSGYHPFVYSIANFPTFRCLEQLRNDVCYHKLPTTVVSVGAGFAYGALGYSHHAVEDAAVMRALPGMTVVSPADPWETSKATLALADLSSPSYLRLGRRENQSFLEESPATLSRSACPFATRRARASLFSSWGLCLSPR